MIICFLMHYRAGFTLEHGGDDGERLAKASRSKLIKESNKDYKRSGSGNESHESYTLFCY